MNEIKQKEKTKTNTQQTIEYIYIYAIIDTANTNTNTNTTTAQRTKKINTTIKGAPVPPNEPKSGSVCPNSELF